MSELLGHVLNFCYNVCPVYVIALIIFTLFTKVILLPFSVWVHFNSIKAVEMMPDINEMKIKYYGDRDTINEKTLDIYKQYKYSPFIDIIPMILQLVLLFCVIDVINMPELANISISDMLNFGVDFSAKTIDVGGLYFLFPLIAAFSSFLMSFTQNRSQVMQSEQNNINKYGIMILSVGLSLYLGIFVSVGVTVYWTASNIFSILQMYILNAIINPKKHVDYERLEKTKAELKDMNNTDKGLTFEQRKLQKKDYKRFFSVLNKHVVFYSEGKGYYKYFRRLIEWLLVNSNIIIHYVTSDPNDDILKNENPRIKSYFIGERKLITLFMKMDADIVIMTTPDLDNYHLKRSYVRKDVEYIYIDHAMGDINMGMREKSLDNFDTVFCTTTYMYDEIRAREKLYSLPEKTLIKAGYGMIEDVISQYNENPHSVNDVRTVLVAPSYQKDNILDSCLDNVIEALRKLDCKVVIRPHPQFIKRKKSTWDSIVDKYKDAMNVVLESDFSSNVTIYTADMVVTDWSGIAYEYSFSTLRPVLFIDTPMKIVNPSYEKLNIKPIDVDLRNQIGKSVSGDNVDDILTVAQELFDSDYSSQISSVRDSIIYNLMSSTDIEGDYILNKLVKG